MNEPIVMDCEGSGHPGIEIRGAVVCAMCGEVPVYVYRDSEGQRIVGSHRRLDVLAMIDRGDFT